MQHVNCLQASSDEDCNLEEEDDENTRNTKQNSAVVLSNLKYRRSRSICTKNVLVFDCSQSVPLQGCCF